MVRAHNWYLKLFVCHKKNCISSRVIDLELAPEKSIVAAGCHPTDKPVVAHPAIGLCEMGNLAREAPLVTCRAPPSRRE